MEQGARTAPHDQATYRYVSAAPTAPLRFAVALCSVYLLHIARHVSSSMSICDTEIAKPI